MMYRLCLLGPTGRIAKVHRFRANTDEGAIAMAREMLGDDERAQANYIGNPAEPSLAARQALRQFLGDAKQTLATLHLTPYVAWFNTHGVPDNDEVIKEIGALALKTPPLAAHGFDGNFSGLLDQFLCHLG